MRIAIGFQKFLVGTLITITALYVSNWVVEAISESTKSGILGICGPYGKHAGLIGLLDLAILPVSITAGIASAWSYGLLHYFFFVYGKTKTFQCGGIKKNCGRSKRLMSESTSQLSFLFPISASLR